LQRSESCLNVLKRPPRIPEGKFANSYHHLPAINYRDGQFVWLARRVELKTIPNSGVLVGPEAVSFRNDSYQVV